MPRANGSIAMVVTLFSLRKTTMSFSSYHSARRTILFTVLYLPFCLPAAADEPQSPADQPDTTSKKAILIRPLLKVPATPSTPADTDKAPASDQFQSTHKQARIIQPMHKGLPIQLRTYALDKEGNLLTCVGGSESKLVLNPDGTQETKTIESPKLLQMYSPEGQLIRETELPFTPTAINQAADGTIFVAGQGKIGRVGPDGKLLSTADSPHIGDLETFKKRIAEGAKKQMEEFTENFRTQIQRIDERIAAMKEKPEAELTERDIKRLAVYEQQKSLYQEQIQMQETALSSAFDPQQLMTRKMGITSLAVTSRDLFVCCNAIEGYGYEVWRMTHEFSEPVRVVTELGGCCGQCDIQATEQHLVLAENTKFKVGLLDRDGTRLLDFGKGDRRAVDGFGSCCNPMNVRCCDNGDILTAESSIGTIKRFNSSGQLISVVGKAKIGGGCKHVAVGFDAKRDRYYMMNVDKSHICVLVPNAEAPETTPDELLSRAAREGLGKKLIGEWSLNGRSRETAKPAQGPQNAISLIIQGISGAEPEEVTNDPYSMSWLQFCTDGSLKTPESFAGAGTLAWEAISQSGNTLLVSKVEDNIQYYHYQVEFVSDNEATISLMFNDTVLASNRFLRVVDNAVTPSNQSDRTPAENTSDVAPSGAKP